MAWIDERIYAHPKVLRVSKAARWTYVAGIAYSSGWGTKGILEASALEAINCERRHRRELVDAGLWDETPYGVIVHDWDEHNEARDKRREAERERKRQYRKSRASAGRPTGQDADKPRDKGGTFNGTTGGTVAGTARVEGSEGSEGSDKSKTKELAATTKKPRAADPIWDALVAIFGAAPEGMERGRWNKAAQSMRQSNATAEHVYAAANAYRTVMPEGTLMTPTALASNWTLLTAKRATDDELYTARLRQRIAEGEA